MTEFPNINRCEMTDCVYNVDNLCHTFAISVSSGNSARCQTYATGNMKGGDRNLIARVGSCKANACEHNQNLECQAPGINIGYKSGEPADCLTFKARQPIQV